MHKIIRILHRKHNYTLYFCLTLLAATASWKITMILSLHVPIFIKIQNTMTKFTVRHNIIFCQRQIVKQYKVLADRSLSSSSSYFVCHYTHSWSVSSHCNRMFILLYSINNSSLYYQYSLYSNSQKKEAFKPASDDHHWLDLTKPDVTCTATAQTFIKRTTCMFMITFVAEWRDCDNYFVTSPAERLTRHWKAHHWAHMTFVYSSAV